jgi:CHAD domain-containing protein
MADIHRETERKYDVGDRFRLPELSGHGPIAGVSEPDEILLEATYFDTPDHRLAAARSTLRRRTGGSDAGWHLKLPVSDGVRDELRAPLDGAIATVPEPLAALTTGMVRGAPVGPIVRLRTERTVYRLTGTGPDGSETVLAEVADDRVVALGTGTGVEITTWRELEVELVDGTPDLLEVVERRLRKAGAVRSSSSSKLGRAIGHTAPTRRRDGMSASSRAGEVLGEYVRQEVAAVVEQDPRVRLDQEDAVHQMRVSARRLRSILGAYRPLFDRSVTDPIRDELKWLGIVLGAARDAEVMHERLRAAIEDEPAELVLGPVAARIDAGLRQRYAEAHREVLAALDGERYLSLLHALHELVADAPSGPAARKRADAVVPQRVRKSWKRVRDAAVTAAAASPDHRAEALHEVRKAAKRARYSAEAAAPAFGPAAAVFGTRMKEVQTVLGDHNDSVVTRAELRTMATQAFLAGENGFTFGRLHAREQASGEALAAAYEEAWAKASAKKLRRWMR